MIKAITSLIYLLSVYIMAQPGNIKFESTEILPNNEVAFRIYAPKANKVALRCDISKKSAQFIKNDQGVWEGVYTNVEPGAYRYRFIVDGVTTFDPQKSSSTEAASIFMMTSGNDFFSMKENVPHGAITQRYFKSEILNEMRRMQIWTPAGFEKSTKKLPVLYLIHGGGDIDKAWPTVGCAGNILDNLLAEGKIEPMLVVMPNARIETPTSLGNLPIFKEDLITGIIPFIESNYNVYTDASHRAIMGLSMGGLQTLEVAMHYYEMFEYICPLSSGWWIADSWAKKRGITDDRELRVKQLKKISTDFNKKVKLVYFTQGGPEDIAYENGMETLKLFDAAGIKYKYREIPGGHSWPVWRKNLRDLAPLLFK
ncbi:alpha/beta hydrolase-fold protein [Lutibacter citreus]|uniref:alpha/beta hydrolase-fold protein n=1 Tax=Lutibacter citreus TaxID=2138210 RepID=UPI000DBE5A1D|nr:alpha/beta hydrolase-fold protein [Lutibacter citreus]